METQTKTQVDSLGKLAAAVGMDVRQMVFIFGLFVGALAMGVFIRVVLYNAHP